MNQLAQAINIPTPTIAGEESCLQYAQNIGVIVLIFLTFLGALVLNELLRKKIQNVVTRGVSSVAFTFLTIEIFLWVTNLLLATNLSQVWPRVGIFFLPWLPRCV